MPTMQTTVEISWQKLEDSLQFAPDFVQEWTFQVMEVNYKPLMGNLFTSPAMTQGESLTWAAEQAEKQARLAGSEASSIIQVGMLAL